MCQRVFYNFHRHLTERRAHVSITLDSVAMLHIFSVASWRILHRNMVDISDYSLGHGLTVSIFRSNSTLMIETASHIWVCMHIGPF